MLLAATNGCSDGCNDGCHDGCSVGCSDGGSDGGSDGSNVGGSDDGNDFTNVPDIRFGFFWLPRVSAFTQHLLLSFPNTQYLQPIVAMQWAQHLSGVVLLKPPFTRSEPT